MLRDFCSSRSSQAPSGGHSTERTAVPEPLSRSRRAGGSYRRHLAVPKRLYRRRCDGPEITAADPQSCGRAEGAAPRPRRELPASSASRHGHRGTCSSESSSCCRVLRAPRSAPHTWRLTHGTLLPAVHRAGAEEPHPAAPHPLYTQKSRPQKQFQHLKAKHSTFTRVIKRELVLLPPPIQHHHLPATSVTGTVVFSPLKSHVTPSFLVKIFLLQFQAKQQDLQQHSFSQPCFPLEQNPQSPSRCCPGAGAAQKTLRCRPRWAQPCPAAPCTQVCALCRYP